MELLKARAAIADAEREYATLVERENDPAGFRERMPLAMAAIRNVGSVINSESRRWSRTVAFNDWWKGTQKHPLLRLVKHVRDTEFKERDITTHAAVSRTVHEYIRIGIAAKIEKRYTDGRVERIAIPQDLPRPGVTVSEDPDSTRWTFRREDDREPEREVLPTLRAYLDWMRDEIIPKAEELLA